MADKQSFHLPDLGEGLPDATIVEWFVKVGDTIKLDEPLVSMETAKAVVEVPSPFSGKVLSLAGGDGDVIVTGSVLAEFEIDPNLPQRAAGQDTGHHHGPPPTKSVGSTAPDNDAKVVASDDGGAISDAGTPAPKGEAGTKTEAVREDSGTVVGAMQSSDAVRSEQAVAVGGIKAMPAVRAQARKLGVDLSRVRGSGADGVVTMDDVKRAAADGSAKSGAAGSTRDAFPVHGGSDRSQAASVGAAPAARHSRCMVEVIVAIRLPLRTRAARSCRRPESPCARNRLRYRPPASPSNSRACAATWRGSWPMRTPRSCRPRSATMPTSMPGRPATTSPAAWCARSSALRKRCLRSTPGSTATS